MTSSDTSIYTYRKPVPAVRLDGLAPLANNVVGNSIASLVDLNPK